MKKKIPNLRFRPNISLIFHHVNPELGKRKATQKYKGWEESNCNTALYKSFIIQGINFNMPLV